ncbi:hypothetical protein HN011_003807 [Eciton burchellii]|nr:hypothetical protein HN011_003807 [Eciton burchellii]
MIASSRFLAGVIAGATRLEGRKSIYRSLRVQTPRRSPCSRGGNSSKARRGLLLRVHDRACFRILIAGELSDESCTVVDPCLGRHCPFSSSARVCFLPKRRKEVAKSARGKIDTRSKGITDACSLRLRGGLRRTIRLSVEAMAERLPRLSAVQHAITDHPRLDDHYCSRHNRADQLDRCSSRSAAEGQLFSTSLGARFLLERTCKSSCRHCGSACILFVVREKVGFERTSGSSCCKPHHSASLIPGKMYPNEYVNTSLGRFLRLLQACRVAAVPDDGNTERNRLLLLRSHVLSDGRVTRGKTSGKNASKEDRKLKTHAKRAMKQQMVNVARATCSIWSA